MKSAKSNRRALVRQLAHPPAGPGAPERAGHSDDQGLARPRHHRRAARLCSAPVRGGRAHRWAGEYPGVKAGASFAGSPGFLRLAELRTRPRAEKRIFASRKCVRTPVNIDSRRVFVCQIAFFTTPPKRVEKCRTSLIHPDGFSAPELLELGRPQGWTLKPARLR